jgi:hypothetical protein
VALTVIAPIALLAIPVIWAITEGRDLDPLEPLWPLVTLFGFAYVLVPGLATLDPQAFTSMPGYADWPATHRLYATWLAASAFLALLLGYRTRAGQRLGRLLGRLPGTTGPRLIAGTALGLFVAGLASIAATIGINDGLELGIVDLLTGELRQSTVASFTGRGYLSVGFAALALSIPCAALWAAASGSRGRWLLTAAAAGVAFVCLGGIVGSRIYALSIPVGVLVVVHYRVRRLSWRLAVTIAAVTLVAGVVQFAARGDADLSGPVTGAGALAQTLNGFEFLVETVARTDRFLWGQSVLEDAVLTYIPRGLWGDKPVVFGFVRAQEAVVPGLYRDLDQAATLPVGIVAEGYLNFGVLGAIVFPFAAALVLRALYLRVAAQPDPFFVLLLAWAIPNILSLLRGGGQMLPATALTVLMLCPLLVGATRHRQ